MTQKQQTIAAEVAFSGRGLHTGKLANITIKPAPENHGVVFQRIDLPGKPIVRAHINNVADTSRSTNLREDGVDVKTVEHLLSVCSGMGIDNVVIEIDNEEVPILDGSGKEYVEKIQKVGIQSQQANREYYTVEEVVMFEKPDQGIELILMPSQHQKFTVIIDYGTDALASQCVTLKDLSQYVPDVYDSRTFVFLHELQFLVKNNLIKGGDLNNAIVFVDKKPKQEELDQLAQFFGVGDVQVTKNGTLDNVKLRYLNEPARHKLLDLIGDLFLLGKPIKGDIIAKKPGHFANTEFAKLIAEVMIPKK
ncbi:MAG TPA: UDP-3-O-acyl-N-acetylglucosamine deacetylase [Bacteroidales bacterium]|nr:UDP-3-O-acyl-N-acetylglucosamine deacetylase [Bacteroidales bacterium]HOH22195.1 UDP-3-O-acyl-N-acetylglucosamine deacetylase [Bacteroidales bacterium]HPZ02620.1 UDP-3-O-acyl-N-acetylglucosamine deacetylase [Bacteroidales bacterium]HQB74481.1 UDP-3-O-acyl-N-acetylglucosamine deacetylase [Bacteroidales bacterium]